jgi:hypothetical protein
VEQLVSNAITAVKKARHEGTDTAAGESEDASSVVVTAGTTETEGQGHGPFVGVPLHPVAGAYSIAMLVRCLTSSFSLTPTGSLFWRNFP